MASLSNRLAIAIVLTGCGKQAAVQKAPVDATSSVDSASHVVDAAGSGSAVLTVVSLTATASTVTGGAPAIGETDTIELVAIVTDTAGLSTIAGGQLLDANGATYAAFEGGATMGTYAVTRTFLQINQTAPITFTSSGARTFVAKFFDNAGNTATASIQLGLACRDGFGLENACGGTCTDPMFDPNNCGGCGTVCGTGQECLSGQCAAVPAHSCIVSRAVADGTTCTQICATALDVCNPTEGGLYFLNGTCAGTFAGTISCNATVGHSAAPAESFVCPCP